MVNELLNKNKDIKKILSNLNEKYHLDLSINEIYFDYNGLFIEYKSIYSIIDDEYIIIRFSGGSLFLKK